MLMFLGIFSVSASVYSQEARVSLDMRNRPLSELIATIKRQTTYSFLFDAEEVDVGTRVTVNAKDTQVKDVLRTALNTHGLESRMSGNHILIVRSRPNTTNTALQRIVRGTVRNDANEPISGATVSVKGTSLSAQTDADGTFSINLPAEGNVLTISYVGMQTLEVVPNPDGSMLAIMLDSATSDMEEVVVTALGITREARSLSYNVQRIASKEITTVQDANFVNALAGKVAGVTINASSSGVGGSTRVVMRGTKSIAGNNNALFVVDGIPLLSHTSDQPGDLFSGAGQTGDGLSNFNPEDVESVNILSGPAAAALYGSEAANGVIMITTKRGQKDSFSATISNSTLFFEPFVLPRFQNTYGSEQGSYHSWGSRLPTPSTYNPRDYFQTGFNTTNSMSLSTGTDRNQTYFSASTVNAGGIIHNNDLDRYNLSFRNTSTLIENKLSIDLNAMYMKIQEQNMLAQGQYFNPLIPVYLFPRGDDFRKYQVFERYNVERNFQTQFWPFGDLGFQMQNPYWITERNMFMNDKDRYLLGTGVNYRIADWINVTARANLDINKAESERKLHASTAGLFAGPAGAYYKYNTSSRQLYADAIVNIDKNISDDVSFVANVGTSIRDVMYDHSSFGGDLMSVPNVFTYSNVNLAQAEAFQNGYRDHTQALFATAQFGYRGMLFLDVTGRNDWASALVNTNANSIFYPSVGVSAIMTDIFDIRSDVLSFLKMRASYSEVGNAPWRHISIPTYPILDGFPQTTTALPASNLEPERTKSLEAGFELWLWNDKVKLDATLYQSATYNQLFNPSLSASSGYNSFFVNAGRIDNRGIEATVSLNQPLGDINWNSTLVYSLNRNRIRQLLPEYTIPQTGETVSINRLDVGGTGSYRMELFEGRSMGDIYVTTLQVDPQGYIWVHPVSSTVMPDHNTYIRAGDSNPLYNLGFRNSFSYKGLDVGFLVTARVGGVGVSVTQGIMDAFGVSEATAIARDEGGALVNGYRIPAQPYYQTTGGGVAGVGSMYVYSATNARLAEASIGYDVPLGNTSRWMKGLSLSLIGRNLLMLYNKAPFDPEATANTGTYYQGIDYFMQPSLRNIGFALRVRL